MIVIVSDHTRSHMSANAQYKSTRDAHQKSDPAVFMLWFPKWDGRAGAELEGHPKCAGRGGL